MLQPHFNQSSISSLFHVVVDNDATATRVLEIMLREKAGRVTFMPLNRLKPKNPPLPDNETEGTFPLMKKLRFAPELEKAFQQVFGKTCVCPNLTVAAAYVKSHGVNTITLDGDKVERKGAITGGYHDFRRSRVEAINNLTIRRNKFEEYEKASKEVKDAIMKWDQEITHVSGKISVNQAKQGQIREERERVMEEGTSLTQEKHVLEGRIGKFEADILDLETELVQLTAKVDGYKAEVGTPLVNGLTPDEEAEIERLSKDGERLKQAMIKLTEQVNEVCSALPPLTFAVG